MEYFKINYKKLEQLHEYNYFVFIILIILIIITLIIIGISKSVYMTETFYGIYTDNILKAKIDIKLSDKVVNNKNIIFNNKNVSYEVIGFEDYEILGDNIYQVINLKVDGELYQNEVGIIKLQYGKKKLIAYVFDLFK